VTAGARSTSSLSGARLAVDPGNDTDRFLAVDTAGRQLDQHTARRPPPLTRAELLGWARRRWPQERVWAGGLPVRHRPAGTDVSAARHDRASWEVELVVDYRERLVAEHTP
jgi:hypothetical protein